MKNNEKQILNNFAEKLIKSQTDLEPEFQEAANMLFEQMFEDAADDPLLAHSHKNNPLSLDELNKRHNGETKLLWHSNYWDGPISGMMLWNGEPHWYNQYDEETIVEPWTQQEIDEYIAEYGDDNQGDWNEYETRRFYKVYKLTPNELKHEFKEHKLFQKYVGTHCDYDDENTRTVGATRKPWWHRFFYKKQKKRNQGFELQLTEDKIVGYFKF